MESDLFNGALPFPVNFTTFAIGMIVLCAAVAFTRGVMGMFVGLACLLVGAFAGYASHAKLPEVLERAFGEPSPTFVFLVALAFGFSVYVVLRLLAGAILISPLRKAGGGAGMVRGPIGAALSLIPAAGMVFLAGMGLRLAGSLFSVEHTDAGVAIEEGQSAEQRPFWARWNEAMDRDYLGSLVAKLDPLATRARGAIGNLLVTLKDDAAGGKLAEDPTAAGVLRAEPVRELVNDPELLDLVERSDLIRLLDHPKIRRVAADPEVAELLRNLRVEEAVDSSLYALEGSGELRRRERRLRLFGRP